MAALLALALVAVWALALTAWPDLPERIPTRFDMQGQAIAWGEPAFGTWFVLPTLATAVAGGLGLALPSWIVALARRNSSMLNMPQRAKFRALPEAARVRAAGAMASGLQRLSLLLAIAFRELCQDARAHAVTHAKCCVCGSVVVRLWFGCGWVNPVGCACALVAENKVLRVGRNVSKPAAHTCYGRSIKCSLSRMRTQLEQRQQANKQAITRSVTQLVTPQKTPH